MTLETTTYATSTLHLITEADQLQTIPDEPKPTPEPTYEPTAEDLAEYRQWCERIDRKWWEQVIDRGPTAEDEEEAHQFCEAEDQARAME